jgi:hypothetical protein
MASFDQENMEFLTSGWNASFFFAELSDKAKLGCLSLKSLCQALYEKD